MNTSYVQIANRPSAADEAKLRAVGVWSQRGVDGQMYLCGSQQWAHGSDAGDRIIACARRAGVAVQRATCPAPSAEQLLADVLAEQRRLWAEALAR